MKSNDDTEDRKAIRNELVLIQVQTNYIAAMQFAQSRIWHAVNLLLGLPAAGAATVAGGLALSGLTNAPIVGVLALASGVVGSFQTILGAQRRQLDSERAGNSYLEVRNAARRLAELDLRNMTCEQARARLKEISTRQEEINRAADPPSGTAIRRGRKYAEGKLATPLRPHGVTVNTENPTSPPTPPE